MPINKQRTLSYIQQEWGRYVERFNRLTPDEQIKRVNQQGYESFRDMLAHILAWWEEGMGIIRAIAEERQFERRKYDFDAFNADAVVRYKAWEEAEFMAHVETARQEMEAYLKSMDDAFFENRRVKAWIRAVITHHAREHSVTVSRFLVMDMLENEWATYMDDYNRLDDEKKREFLSKQGFETFHDLLAHIVGWWEEGSRIIRGILNSPGFIWESHDVDAFNAELTKKFSQWSDDDLFQHYETVRVAMLELTAELPEDAFSNEDIEGWLRDDVIVHYDEHPMPA